MMNIIEAPIQKNQYSRPGRPLVGVQALVIHWTANPGQSAEGVRSFFALREAGEDGYGSAHYVIGLEGEILRMITEDEMAYHVGTSQVDPASGKYYTDLGRQKFGKYAIDFQNLSPNFVTLGIEHCVTDGEGSMTEATVEASIELAADICKRHGLNPATDLLLHKDVVGWKDCHRWYVNNPDAWTNYKAAVARMMQT